MKKFFIFTLLLLGFVVFIACVNDNNENYPSQTVEPIVKTTMTSKQLTAALSEMNKKFGSNTRSGAMEITEEEIVTILAPFISDGMNIRSQITDAYNMGLTENINQEDIVILNNMTDDQLATLSVVTVFTDESIMNDLEVSITDVGKCLGTALGIEEFGQMYLKGTKALMSVSSAIKVAKIMIQRYVGYFGALIMLY